MKVPVATPDITDEDVQKVSECVKSGWVSGISPYVTEFEEKFAEWNGSKYATVTGSGTTALHLALAALGLPPGSEVIMPSLTMIASANACNYLGLKPVFADIEPDTWCVNPEKIEEVITPDTKAIMPVHIYGHPCDMGRIMEIAWDHDLMVVEDCAEAHGATWKKKKVGTFGDMNAYSFYANKIITTGEGGIITTDDRELDDKAKWLRAHAFGKHGKHYWHDTVGYGYRMSGMQAALGTSQLSRIDYYINKRRLHAWYYKSKLKPLEEAGLITMPVQRENYENVYWMFSVIFSPELLSRVPRASIIAEMENLGIETRTFFYPLHNLPPYWSDKPLPITDDVSRRGINLPSGNQLTNEQIEYVCDCLKEIIS